MIFKGKRLVLRSKLLKNQVASALVQKQLGKLLSFQVNLMVEFQVALT